MNDTQTLAAFIASAEPGGGMPQQLRDKMAECLVDFVGISAFALHKIDSSQAILDGIGFLSEGREAGDGFTVVGDDRSWSLSDAAMLNGTFAHSMDFDDTHGAAALHPGAPVIAACLGWAERDAGINGRQFLEAIALGCEVACRVGLALNTQTYQRGFHPTAIAGVFGATASGCRLLRLNSAQVASALGLAGSLAAGSMQYMENGALNKRLHPGFAARHSILALSLAKANVLGAANAIEGRYGFLNSYSDTPAVDALTRELGSRWDALDTAIKPYPSCRAAHGAIEAALALRKIAAERGLLNPQLHLTLRSRQWELVAEPSPAKLDPKNVVDAQFSVYFQLACAWLDGEFNWGSYARIGAPDVHSFSQRIRVTHDDSLPPMSCRLQIEGTDLCHEVIGMAGEKNNPLDRSVISRKYRSLAQPVFGRQRAECLLRDLFDIESAASARAVIRSMRHAKSEATSHAIDNQTEPTP